MKTVALVDIPLEKNVVREVSVDGRKVTGALSSFDFPTRFRISLSEKGDRATVDCLYAAAPEEFGPETKGPDGAVLFLGKTSGRILRMEFPVPVGVARFKLELLIREPLKELKSRASRLSWEERPARRLAHYLMFPDLVPLIEDKLAKLRDEQGASALR